MTATTTLADLDQYLIADNGACRVYHFPGRRVSVAPDPERPGRFEVWDHGIGDLVDNLTAAEVDTRLREFATGPVHH